MRPTVTTRALDPGDPVAVEILHDYLFDVASRYYGRDATDDEMRDAGAEHPNDDLADPHGVLLVVLDGARAVACGGARFLPDGDAELTRVYVRPEHRGHGFATAVLDAIEERCRSRGVGTLRLDTRSDLVEARALYARRGYAEVPAFNDAPYAEHWFAKQLLPASAG